MQDSSSRWLACMHSIGNADRSWRLPVLHWACLHACMWQIYSICNNTGASYVSAVLPRQRWCDCTHVHNWKFVQECAWTRLQLQCKGTKWAMIYVKLCTRQIGQTSHAQSTSETGHNKICRPRNMFTDIRCTSKQWKELPYDITQIETLCKEIPPGMLSP